MSRRKGITIDTYKIEFVDRVLDPVHGFIDITPVEKEIIQLPIFKRMQSLKQLSLTNWVFPGAEHTRYIHSLGVMYIADLMAQSLRRLDGSLRFNDGERQLLRLAGLLHDIGHYPLSHVTEYVYRDSLEGIDLDLDTHNLNIKKSIDALSQPGKMPDYMKDRYSIQMHHENIGTIVIKNDTDINKIIHRHCPFIDVQDILDIIVGCVNRNEKISAMVQLVHSELDADGIDYIMRDSTFSGTSYGGFELGLLLRNLVVAEYNGIEIVGIKPKGISVVDQYLVSKYFAYTQVIFNKHVAILDEMVEIFSKALISLDKSPYPSSKTLIKYIENHDKNSEYLKFTDRTFWTQLDRLSRHDLENFVPEYIVAIYDKLQHYQEFKMVDKSEVVLTSNNKAEVCGELQGSAIYQKLMKGCQNIILFHSRGFTSQIPEEQLRELLKDFREDDKAEMLMKNPARLQEGVPVISDDEIKLLVDDKRSIMSYLYSTKTYILREYTVE